VFILHVNIRRCLCSEIICDINLRDGRRCVVELCQRLIDDTTDSSQSTPVYNSLSLLDAVLRPIDNLMSSTQSCDDDCDFEVNVVDDRELSLAVN